MLFANLGVVLQIQYANILEYKANIALASDSQKPASVAWMDY